MTWFKVDDKLHGHRKVMELRRFGPTVWAQAMSLWTVAGSWCADHLTDGKISVHTCEALVPFKPRKALRALVEVGLFDTEDQFHDWLDHQPPRARVLEERERARERMKRRRGSPRGSPERSPERSGERSAMRSPEPPSRVRDPRPDPDPDPDPEISPGGGDPKTTNAARACETGGRTTPTAAESWAEPRTAWGYLVQGYQERYARSGWGIWEAWEHNRPEIESVARYVERAAEAEGKTPGEVGDEVLDGAFASRWMLERRVPWKGIAKDPGRCRADSHAAAEPQTTAFGEAVDESWMQGGFGGG